MGEITDLIFTLIVEFARWLNARGKRIAFIIWALTQIYWIARASSLGLVVQSLASVASTVIYIYGWYNWKNKNIGS